MIGGITKRYRTVAGRPVEDHLYAQPVGAVQVDADLQACERKYISERRRVLALRLLAGLTFAAFLVVLAVGCGPSDIEVTAEQVRAADEAQRDTRAALLTNPLPYTATVRDCLPSGRECTEDRFYIPRSAR